MAVDDVYTLSLYQTYAGQTCINTLAFRVLVSPDVTQAQLQALADDWKNHLKTFQCSGVTYTRWIAQQVRGGTVSYITDPCNRVGGFRNEGLFTGSVVGDGTSEGLPPQSACVTTLKTALAGRTHRGRLYLTGVQEIVQNQGTIVAGNLGTYQTAWNTQLAQFGPTGTDPTFQLGIWSMRTATGCITRKDPPYGMVPQDSPNQGAAFEKVTEAVCRATVYSQRKRTIGVGI